MNDFIFNLQSIQDPLFSIFTQIFIKILPWSLQTILISAQ